MPIEQQSPVVESIDRQYREEIRRAVNQARARGALSLEDVCRLSDGAPPNLVKESLNDALDPSSGDAGSRTERVAFGASYAAWPEASPMDHEWRFTERSAAYVAGLVSNCEAPVLCIGTPTVFAALSMVGQPVTLVERNPILARFLSLQFGSSVLTTDVADLPSATAGRRYRTIVLDPPWYSEHVLFWVHQALMVAEPNARILISLFSSLTRPSARSERTDLVSLLSSRVGALRVLSQLTYVTPIFEQETFRAAGLPDCPEWRTGDLIELRVENSQGLGIAEPPREPSWMRFVLGSQIVGVRRDSGREGALELTPLYPDGSYLLKSVSRRDPVRSSIGLWTSRNRCARVLGTARLVQILGRLQAGETPLQLSRASASEGERLALHRLFALVGI
jgi:hypothetical protein